VAVVWAKVSSLVETVCEICRSKVRQNISSLLLTSSLLKSSGCAAPRFSAAAPSSETPCPPARNKTDPPKPLKAPGLTRSSCKQQRPKHGDTTFVFGGSDGGCSSRMILLAVTSKTGSFNAGMELFFMTTHYVSFSYHAKLNVCETRIL
jgi:hypothetical protein